MREEDIMHERGDRWVGRDRRLGLYLVFRAGITHSTSEDVGYALTPDGLSIAIAVCNDLAVQDARRQEGRSEVIATNTPPEFVPVNDVANALAARKRRQAFFTPMALCQKLVEWSHALPSMRVLEPSAGDGRIVHVLQHEAGVKRVDACEIDEVMRERLTGMSANVVGSDFLAYQPGPIYDLIVMNPPFAKRQAERHLEHAWTLLKPHGRILSIAPPTVGQRLDEHALDLPECEDATWERLGREHFVEYGTNVEVVVVELCRLPRQQCQGFTNHATFNAWVTISSDGDLYHAHRHRLTTADAARQTFSRIIGRLGCSVYGVDWQAVLDGLRCTWGAEEQGPAGASPERILEHKPETAGHAYLRRLAMTPAIGAGNAIVHGQQPSGAYSTWGFDKRFGRSLLTLDWPGCNAVAVTALSELSHYLKSPAEARQAPQPL